MDLILKSLQLVLFGIFVNVIKGSVPVENSFSLDLNDILDTNLMPSALFLQQEIQIVKNDSLLELPVMGDFGKAYQLMGFHRKMMNEYLCNSFIARQIIFEVAPNINSSLSRRVGVSIQEGNFTKTNLSISKRKPKMIPNEELLYDSGSEGYKNWLTKTTTLEDIYRQFSSNMISTTTAPSLKNQVQGRTTSSTRRNSFSNEGTAQGTYIEGEMTGYAVAQQVPAQRQPEYYEPELIPERSKIMNMPMPQPYPTAGSKNGYYPSAHEGYEAPYSVHHYEHHPEPAISKELGLREVMEIAMTTLAYLSFGMFILQVLMCITMDKTNLPMMMPMENTDGGDVEEIRRKKRSIIEDEYLERINEISRRVLLSMDAVIYVKHDDGHCLFRSLCDFNNYARELKNNQKMWMPLWSLGLSWLSSRMARPNINTNIRLASLKAAVFGLGGANCSKTYSICEYSKMLEIRGKERDATDTTDFKFNWNS